MKVKQVMLYITALLIVASTTTFGYGYSQTPSTWNTNKMFTGFVNPEGGAVKNIYEMVIEYRQSKNPVP